MNFYFSFSYLDSISYEDLLLWLRVDPIDGLVGLGAPVGFRGLLASLLLRPVRFSTVGISSLLPGRLTRSLGLSTL